MNIIGGYGNRFGGYNNHINKTDNSNHMSIEDSDNNSVKETPLTCNGDDGNHGNNGNVNNDNNNNNGNDNNGNGNNSNDDHDSPPNENNENGGFKPGPFDIRVGEDYLRIRPTTISMPGMDGGKMTTYGLSITLYF